MHSQILAIYPSDVELEDVMYWYQEVDKDQNGKISDDRCQFFLTVSEDEIPWVVDKIEAHLTKHQRKYLEVLQYRSSHSYDETKEVYGSGCAKRCLEFYIYYCDKLEKFNKIKDLPIDDPLKIGFITEYGYYATDRWIDVYIPGKGYGSFHNPWEMWDYYKVVNDRRFPSDVYFLISKDGERSNKLAFRDLDIDSTVANINEFTRVWENIIFCESDPRDSRLYSVDDIRFSKSWNNECLVDDLKTVLVELQGKADKDYVVEALDSHW